MQGIISRILIFNHGKYLLPSDKTTESIRSAIDHGNSKSGWRALQTLHRRNVQILKTVRIIEHLFQNRLDEKAKHQSSPRVATEWIHLRLVRILFQSRAFFFGTTAGFLVPRNFCSRCEL